VISIILQGLPAQLERGITGESFAAHGGRERLEALSRLVDAGTLRPQVEAARDGIMVAPRRRSPIRNSYS